ncbi:MAG: hypothetical protein AAFX04_05750 [Pseudomonadota bacterium]
MTQLPWLLRKSHVIMFLLALLTFILEIYIGYGMYQETRAITSVEDIGPINIEDAVLQRAIFSALFSATWPLGMGILFLWFQTFWLQRSALFSGDPS